MRAGRGLFVGALCAGLAGVPVSPAGAQDAPSAEVLSVGRQVVAHDDGDTAQVLVKYRCTGVPLHLWASVKQGPDLDPAVPGGTSSARAISWREAPEGPVPTCDGKVQVERVTVQATPDTAGRAALTRGEAWVQFVIFVGDPAGFDPESGRGIARGGVGGPAGGQWGVVRGQTAS